MSDAMEAARQLEAGPAAAVEAGPVADSAAALETGQPGAGGGSAEAADAHGTSESSISGVLTPEATMPEAAGSSSPPPVSPPATDALNRLSAALRF